MLNLLKTPKTFKERKRYLLNVLLFFIFCTVLFSVVSGANFLAGVLSAFYVPYPIAVFVGIVVCLIIDNVQQNSAMQIMQDFFRGQKSEQTAKQLENEGMKEEAAVQRSQPWLEPVTLIIFIAFAALSAFLSISGSDYRGQDAKKDNILSDTAQTALLASVISQEAAAIPQEVKKTDKMSWTEFSARLENNKSIRKKIESDSFKLAAAKELHKYTSEQQKKLMETTINVYSLNWKVLIGIQGVFILCCFAAGYYKSFLDDEEEGELKSDKMERSRIFDVFTRREGEDKRVVVEGFQGDKTPKDTNIQLGTCACCGGPFAIKRQNQRFCTPECKTEWHNKNKN